MSDRVALRLAGELTFIPEKQGLQVVITLAHIEDKIACVRQFRIPWQDTDFTNAVKFEVTRYMTEVATGVATKLCHKAPNSYLAIPDATKPTVGSQDASAAVRGPDAPMLPPAPLPPPEAPQKRGSRPPRTMTAPPA